MLDNLKVDEQCDNSHQVLSQYINDTSENKINLSIGLLTDKNNKPILHQAVIEAEKNIVNQYNTSNQIYDKIYPEEGGSKRFLNTAQTILFGQVNPDLISVATPSCGAIALGYQLCKKLGSKTLHLPQPCWQMHSILNNPVQLEEKYYQYTVKNEIDINNIVDYINSNVQKLDVFMIQFSCNNPTGIDYNEEQLNKVLDALNQKQAIAFVDVAYQGIATGSIEKEQQRIKQCFKANQLILCQFFDKNFTIYAEGCSAIHLYVKDASKQQLQQVHELMKQLVSSLFGLAPVHGQQIVQEIWNNKQLKQLYEQELKQIVDSVQQRRLILQNELQNQSLDIDISKQIGIYACFNITVDQVVQLAKQYHIYMLENGRINLCGITQENVKYFVSSLKKVLQ